MKLNQFVAELTERGVKLWAEGDQLRVRAPKGVLTPELRDLLSLYKAELVLLLHQSNANRRDIDPPLVRISRDCNLPLSFAQARMWFLSQLEPNNPFYNEPQALRLHGSVNLVALKKSLNKIIDRHEALRTNFVKVDGQPVQVIALGLTLSVPVVDLRDIPESEKEISVQRLAIAEAQQPFDLASSPLIRAYVLKLTEVEHVLLLTIHHIVFDGWSWGIILRELATLYSAFCNDLSPELPELSIRYRDFAVWQRQWLQGEVLESQLAYWKQQLEGAPALLELPTDRVRPSIQTYRGAHHKFVLSKELTLALMSLIQRQGVTLFMTLLAAFQTFLYRYTGQTDICVGTPHANRDRPEVVPLIGFFVNTLVLRTCLSGNPSFEDVLLKVRDVTLLAHAHQDLPFEKLVEELKLERDLSYTPLVQVMLVLDVPVPQIQMAGLTVSPLPIETATAKFDLTLSFENTASGLIGDWEYNTDLFDASTIARMARHFQTLLEGIVANPQQKVSELPLLTEAERYQLLVEWNNTTKEYPQDKCIHQLFEEQVERNPDAIAVVFEEEQLTYQQLNARANRIAHYLQSLGVGPEVLVGICVERSLEMIVGLLGILKAGGAYVPLDPTYPKERLAFMLENAQARVLLTERQLIKSLSLHQASLICLDTDWQVIARQSEKNPAIGVTLDNLAYVIYTSGSTGKPKGVAMSHRSLSNLIDWQVENSTLSREARTLQFSPVSFDVSFQEIFSTWCSGGMLVLIADEVRRDPLQLWRFLTKEAIARIFLPFVALQQLAEVADTQETSPISLYEIITAGEQLLVSKQIKKLFTKLNNCTLQNQYGPSESHVVTAFTLTGSPSYWPAFPPIGRPITNTQIYILDSHLKPVPIAVFGELHIGGVGLAKGYLNRPELTAEKFILNPFCTKPGSRLYKTGDLARYLPNGNIEFLGRIDEQVKIRGFRIELGEIEAVLAQHPDVIQTVVVAQENIPGSKHLVAYVVSAVGDFMETQDPRKALQRTVTRNLRDYLKQKLPDYMVPSIFVLMRSLPLNPNGKVDRRALRALDNWGMELKDNFVAPTTPTETILAAIWAEVLGVQQVGILDNFFELGGHSLLATQIISCIREAFKIELPLRQLFEAPTIASLSNSIETARLAESKEPSSSRMAFDTLPPLVPTARDTHIPLSFAQKHVWIAQQLYPDSCAYNVPIALRFTGELSPEVLEKSINEIIRRHEILRTTFPLKEEQPVQVIAPSLTLPLKIVDLQHLPLEEREAEAFQLANQEAQHHFDLASGSVLQTTLIRLTQKEHWLLITMHHIITDGWSCDILLQELGTLYNAFSNSLPSSKGAAALTPLPKVPFQYADFTFWQRKRFNEEILQKQFSYWRQKLADIPLSLDILPPDWSQHSTNSRRASFYSLVLPESLVTSMETLSRSQEVTIFAIILTALKILLFKWSGQTDLIVLATTANRSTPEIEKMLGCFINDVILRSQVDGSLIGLALLEQVKTTVSEAISNQEIPFEVVELLSEVKSLRTVGVSMVPSLHWCSQLRDCEVASIPLEHELWDESLLLELYISSPTEDSKTIEIAGYYSMNLFKKETIERLFSSYQGILQQLVQHPETQLSEFELSKETWD